MAEARQELVNLQSEDPTKLLSTEELEGASARREFVADDVAALKESELLSRLQSVLASGDRATQFLFWQAGRRKKAEIAEKSGEQPFELSQLLSGLQTALRGQSHTKRVAEVQQRLDDLGQAQTLAWSLQRGGRSVGAVYAKQSRNPALDQLRQSG